MTEIDSIIDKGIFDDAILGSDFNYDKWKKQRVCVDNGYIFRQVGHWVWEKFGIDYTHLHTDLESSSIRDNFFVNKRLLEHI